MTSQEPFDLLSSTAFEENIQKTTTSREASNHLLHLRKKPINDDEHSLSYSTHVKKMKR